MIAVIGDAVGSGLARLAIQRGGHVRVGLEDYTGTDQPTNRQLIDQVTALADANGHRVANAGETARILGIIS
jgi:3-keto-5-aminohexanoate cleavage enzyme